MQPAQIHHLFTSHGHNYYGRHGQVSVKHGNIRHEAIVLIAGKGIVGDRFQGTEEFEPCYWMDKACGKPSTEEITKGHGGLRCRILDDGVMNIGKYELKALNQILDPAPTRA